MKNMPRLLIVSVVWFWMAAGCQASLAPSLKIGVVFPDMLLCSAVAFSLLVNQTGATWYGFAAGLLHGALAQANLTAYVASRSVAGFAVGFADKFHLDPNPVVAGLAGAMATVIAQLILLILAPSRDIGEFLVATIGQAVYNGVLSTLFFALAKLLVGNTQPR